MGEELGVESTLPRGSKFWFEIPLSHVSTATRPVPATAPYGYMNGIKRLAGIRLLVADDSATNLRFMEAALIDEGADVFLAGSVESA